MYLLVRACQRFWLFRLNDALFTVHFMLGLSSDLHFSPH